MNPSSSTPLGLQPWLWVLCTVVSVTSVVRLVESLGGPGWALVLAGVAVGGFFVLYALRVRRMMRTLQNLQETLAASLVDTGVHKEEIGTLTGEGLVLTDLQSLSYWAGERSPAETFAHIPSTRVREQLLHSQDFRIEGSDQEAVAVALELPGPYLYDVPLERIESVQAHLQEGIRQSGLQATLLPEPRRVSHRERFLRALGRNGGRFDLGLGYAYALPGKEAVLEYSTTRQGVPAFVTVRYSDEEVVRSTLEDTVLLVDNILVVGATPALDLWRARTSIDHTEDMLLVGDNVTGAATALQGRVTLQRQVLWENVAEDEVTLRGSQVLQWLQENDIEAHLFSRPHTDGFFLTEQVYNEGFGSITNAGGGVVGVVVAQSGTFPLISDWDEHGERVAHRVGLQPLKAPDEVTP